MTITRVASSSDVADLAGGLLDAQRRKPWGVVSIPVDADTPLIDVDQLHDDAGDVCQFFVIKTGPLTRELDALLPDRCQVYGGAARIYPVGTEWMTKPERSPLRFAHVGSTAEALVTDALGMADAAGLFAQPTSTSVPARGEVRSLLAGGSRALVVLDSGDYATIIHELTFPDVPLEWVIREGQLVEGQFDPLTKRLTPNIARFDEEQLLERYPHGTATLAYVISVERQSGVLAVHPSLRTPVTRRDVSSNPFDRVDLLLAPGDVVEVRVVRDEQGRTRLRLSDIDDDEVVQPALSLMDAGEPWLVENRHKPQQKPDEDEEWAPETAAMPDDPPVLAVDEVIENDFPKPSPGPHRAIRIEQEFAVPPKASQRQSSALLTTQLALEQERGRTVELEARIKHLGGEAALEHVASMRLELGEVLSGNRRLKDDLRKLRTDQQAQRAMLRQTRQASLVTGYGQRQERFNDETDWVRHEIYLAWVERLDPSDREAWLLPADYGVGGQFAASLDQLDDAARDKSFKAVVDVLTGRVREIPARSPHPLRSGDGMSATDVVRADGARCMRVHIEKSVASARRLHYWVLEGNQIELSRVVLHDDMEP